MNKQEIALLLEYAQNFDNRKITDGMVVAWGEVLAGIPFEIARESVVKAFQADDVKWLEPKHVLRYARPAMDRAKALAQSEAEAEESRRNKAESTPPPLCGHGKRLVDCGPCSKWFATNHETHVVVDIRACGKCLDIMRGKKIPVARQP